MNDLPAIFTAVLNMSITASYVAIGVMLARIFLRRAPKIFSYALWSLVLFRLVCPVSFTSAVSFLGILQVGPQNKAGVMEYVPPDIGMLPSPNLYSGISSLDQAISPLLPQAAPAASVNPMQIWMAVLSLIWLAGMLVLLTHSVISYIRIKRRLRTATLIEDNIYESERIGTAFVCGFVRPKIYVPLGIQAAEYSCLLEHERIHLRRKDYLIKPLAYLALIVHWFNPLMWLSFALMSRDLEMSCDESVLKKVKQDVRGDYSQSLLALSVRKNGLFTANPLAFGESHIKARIKNVLHYKKPTFWMLALAAVIAAAAAAGLFTNPSTTQPDEHRLAAQYLKYKTEYVGDNSKVGGIIYLLTFPQNIAYESLELHTDSEPLAITVHLKSGSETNNLYSGAAYQQQFANNALLMFALIGNVGQIKFSLDDGSGANPSSMQYTRQWADNQYGKDIRDFAQSEEKFGLLLKNISAAGPNTAIEKLVEDNLRAILSSPGTSSNPQDYINAHQDAYENFFKYGGEDALQYMLAQFEAGNAEGLRGQIMMHLCQELLGTRNNVSDESLSPQEWYKALVIRQETMLPDFKYEGQDPIAALVYNTEIEKYAHPTRQGFTIAAPHIFASYEEKDLLKVFVTTYCANYRLFGNNLAEEGGGIVPAAITYRREASGKYVLAEYEQAQDGAYFAPSIRDFCTRPASGKKIAGLADKIMQHYSDYGDIRILMHENLTKHLKRHGIKNAVLSNSLGEIEFYLSSPGYQ